MDSGQEADDQYPGRLLQQAAIYNNVELMDSLLEGPERYHLNAQDPFGRTALYTSVTNNSYECTEKLLLAGADANIACGLQCGGMSPLHAAALDNKERFMCLLLEHNADINKMDASGERPLNLAQKNRSYECVAIIKERLEMNEKMKESLEKEFFEACCIGNHEEAQTLLRNTILCEDDVARLVDDQDLLYKVCENGHVKVCEFLLEIGLGIKSQQTNGYTPFHVACLKGHAGCASAILRFWPNQVEVQTPEGSYPIHLACIYGHLEVVKLLAEFGSEKVIDENTSSKQCFSGAGGLWIRDSRGRTPLHLAVENNHLHIVEFLLNSEPPSGAEGDGSEKTSHRRSNELKSSGEFLSGSKRVKLEKSACSRQLSKELEFLNGSKRVKHEKSVCSRQQSKELLGGVDVDITDSGGKTLLHYAVLGNESMAFYDVAAILLQHRADPNKPLLQPEGTITSPLMEAFRRNDHALMSLLLRYGARDEDYKVARAAIDNEDDEMISVMLQHQSYVDTEYKPNHLAITQAQYELGKSLGFETDLSRSMSFSTGGITISWHSIGLNKIIELWFVNACEYLLKKNHICMEWLLKNPAVALMFVTRIDVSQNNIDVLPDFLFRLPSLRLLNAANNKISCIDRCQEDVSDNASEIVSSRSSLANGNVGKTEVLNCPSLEEINLSKNQFSMVPSVLFQIPALKKLNMSHNVVSSVPFEMWTSTSIIDLNLSYNRLESLPHQTDRNILCDSTPSPPSKLTGLSIRVSPGEQCIKPKPQTGSIAEVVATPNQQAHQQSVTTQNFVSDAPKHVNRWHKKVEVQLSDFEGEGEAIQENHSQLLELNLSHNFLQEVPTALSCLAPQLEKLTLSYNKLTQIGSPDAYPASLKVLDLSYNQISGEICFENFTDTFRMTHDASTAKTCFSPLSSKSCSYASQISSSIGPSFSRTVSLASLMPNWNPAACKHRLHHRLDRLKTLKLNNNKILKFVLCLEGPDDRNFNASGDSTKRFQESKPIPIIRRPSLILDYPDKKKIEVLYPNLTSLDLSCNEIVNLPSEICELAHLAELKISYNKIRELPPEMGLMKKLWNIDFSNCPVADSLSSLLGDKARKTSAVLGYLKSIRDEAVPFNRMKLMLVGIQGIGKTSLLNQLREKKSKHPHWVERMGRNTQGRDQRGENISTVGVDIGDLELQAPNGKVIFSTWDFGGQKEYYATHQYFLSKRSLYLVVWKVTDGEKGVNEILKWLINIQARVPGSPVIIVGTHRDQVPKRNREAFLNEMGQLIKKKYMDMSEPDKQGLPRVLEHIEVSCKNTLIGKTYIPELRGLIGRVVSEEQLPGVKGTRLLDQKVPARYLHLQVVVETLAKQRKAHHKDPVLHADQYKHMVIAKMEEMYKASFQDMTELSQATQFLHENGVLLHYDEVHLQDVYFLDPQWLCDMLASIITIREINSLAKYGVMKTDDLKVLFKGVAFKASDIKSYMINLLHKFEVALLWDPEHLLIPSLLPTERDIANGLPDSQVIISLNKSFMSMIHDPILSAPSTLERRSTFRGYLATANMMGPASQQPSSVVTNIHNPAVSIVRLYLMSYFPCGFWPRLITRLLGDRSFLDLALLLYDSADSLPQVADALEKLKQCVQWQCWQTGLELKLNRITILRLKEVSCDSLCNDYDYGSRRLLINHEQECNWCPVDARSLSILEVFLPNESLQVRIPADKDRLLSSEQTVTIHPKAQTISALLTVAVDRIDTLLEDWYPDIGIRFTQTTKGMYLITRLVPCIRCLFHQNDFEELSNCTDDWSLVSVNGSSHRSDIEGSCKSSCSVPPSPTHSVSGYLGPTTSTSGKRSSRTQSLSDVPSIAGRSNSPSVWYDTGGKIHQKSEHSDDTRSTIENDCSAVEEADLANGVYCFLFEACLQAAQRNRVVSCPVHGNLGPYFTASKSGLIYTTHIAPDTIFQDVDEDKLITSDTVSLGKFLGRGAFGAVYAGSILNKVTGEAIPAAMKFLQPVKPSSDETESRLHQYNVEKSKWDRDPVKNSCEAYLNARKELGIMLTLKHPNIVPLLGISLNPLSLILSLAPQGALYDHLKVYERAGTRVPVYVIRDIIIQVASALQYLHSLQIIYRDLKSENVLVWSLPFPHAEDDDHELQVDVKLADYGVSRVVLPVGTKGFAGTLPFMAPEIIQHNGEEMYTEKVDCFSFGMFIYELLLLKAPYEDKGSVNGSHLNLKGHVMSGGRPMITSKEVLRPVNILNLMTLCWSRDPNDRPSAKEIVEFAQSPEFCSLFNVVSLENAEDVVCACSVRRNQEIDAGWMIDMENGMFGMSQSDVWVSVRTKENSSGSLVVCTYQEQECLQIKKLNVSVPAVTVMCPTSADIWCATSGTTIHVFRQSDYKEILKFSASSRFGASVQCMTFGHVEDAVYAILDDGHIVVCCATIPENVEPSFTPVRQEIQGNSKPIRCIVFVTISESLSELWCGQGHGKILIWNLETSGENGRVLNHFNTEENRVDTFYLVTCSSDPFTLYSYVYPGTTVYCWDTSTKSLLARVNLVEHISPTKFGSHSTQNSSKSRAVKWQVSCMNVINQFLYVGTTGGCLVVINRHSLTPLTTCQPYGDGFPNISVILPLFEPKSLRPLDVNVSLTDATVLPGSSVLQQSHSMFVTVGKGYRDIAMNMMLKYKGETTDNGIYVHAWSGEEWPAETQLEKCVC